MIDSSFPHPRLTRHTVAGSAPEPSQVALLPASDSFAAQLGLARPRGHVNSESIA
jgi:hypothetical protein